MDPLKPMRPIQPLSDLSATRRWPVEMGEAVSSGSSGDLRYAYFPQARRLPIEQQGRLTLYDTGDINFVGCLKGMAPTVPLPP